MGNYLKILWEKWDKGVRVRELHAFLCDLVPLRAFLFLQQSENCFGARRKQKDSYSGN